MRVTIPSGRTRDFVTTYGSALPILLGTIALMVTLAQHGGYFVTDWYPAGLVLLGLLAVALVSTARMRPPRAVIVAVALLVGYAAWSYLSISWSHQRGLAWDGANRTMLYAIVFALFAWRPLPGRAAGVAVGLLTAAAAGIGLAELVHLLGAANPRADFIGGRLAEPVGYPNGDAVLFTMGLFLCAGIACVRSLASPLRGASFGGAVLLGGLALMAQSRGWLFILPVGALVFVALAPDPFRALLALAGVATGILAVRGPVLDIHASLATGASFKATVHSGVHAVLVAAAVAAVAGTVLAELDRRAGLPWRGYARSGRVVLAVGAGLALAALAGFWLVSPDPGGKVSHAWKDFKGGQKAETAQSRFASGLGSNRYDFWRVGMAAFRAHPIGGLGADTFAQEYLRHRRSSEQPLYPHSVEVRALAETGIVGTLLLAAGLVAAFVAAVGSAARRRSREGAAAAGACVAAASWWLLQGSIDWFWEFAGLGMFAFALLGLAAAMRPADLDAQRAAAGRARVPQAVPAIAGGLAALAVALAFALPWLAEREVQDASRIWVAQPKQAYDGLDRAARLNPLSSRPDLIAGTIAFRLGDPRRARTAFSDALARESGSPYAALELGLAEALLGNRAAALRHLHAARAADPGDGISARALQIVSRGKRPNVAAINALIDNRARDRLR